MTIRKRGWDQPNTYHWPWVFGRRATAMAAAMRAVSVGLETPVFEEGNRHARRTFNSTPAKRYRQKLALDNIAAQLREAKKNGLVAVKLGGS